MKLQLLLILYSVKNRIEAKSKQNWYYKYLPAKVAEGFTLAEVLITLLIIGIVASLVIPALINDTQDAELHTAFKKTYSDLDQATRRVLMDNGGSFMNLCNNWGNNCLRNEYAKYLSFMKSCNSGETAGVCWFKNDGSSTFLNGNGIYSWGAYSGLVLNNGALVVFEYTSSNCSDTSWYSSDCGYINFDTNGFKKPNKVGKDIFYIHIKTTGIKPGGTSDGEGCSGFGVGCAAKYLSQ